jgi:hypothetical protein
MRAGFLMNTRKAYFGLSTNVYSSIHHDHTHIELKRFNTARGVIYPDFILYAQSGYTFQRSPDSKFAFTPQLVLGYYHPSDKYIPGDVADGLFLKDLSVMFRYNKLIWGGNITGYAVGLQSTRLKLMYTQRLDFMNYSANVSLRYIFKDAGSRSKRKNSLTVVTGR